MRVSRAVRALRAISSSKASMQLGLSVMLCCHHAAANRAANRAAGGERRTHPTPP